MEKIKQKWNRPKLVILVKGGSEQEAVLSACKMGAGGGGPNGVDPAASRDCYLDIGTGCVTCDSSSPS
jgi:hypothetical protein